MYRKIFVAVFNSRDVDIYTIATEILDKDTKIYKPYSFTTEESQELSALDFL